VDERKQLRGFVGVEKTAQRPSNHQRTREELPRGEQEQRQSTNINEVDQNNDDGWMMSSRRLRSHAFSSLPNASILLFASCLALLIPLFVY
jgi:hypothetical protein